MLEAGLIVSRFVHYIAVLVLFGASLFPLYARPGRAASLAVRLEPMLERTQLATAALAIVSSVPWLFFTAANMSGSLEATDWEALWLVIAETHFGSVWVVRILLASLTILVLLATKKVLEFRKVLLLPIAATLLASLSGIGHTQHSGSLAEMFHVTADALHLLAAGAWIGGLVILAVVLSHPSDDAERVLQRFSGMGYVAVSVLMLSGLINSWYLVGDVDRLVSTLYGRVLLAKLVVFVGMLALAVTNRFWLMPLLQKGTDAKVVLKNLRRHVLAEQTLGFLVVLLVSALGTLDPAA